MTPEERLRAWGAEPVCAPWSSRSSVLTNGIRDGLPVVLKIPRVEEEVRGTALLAWWAGRGAVPVLEHDGDAVLMVRASGSRDLAAMARGRRDGEAAAVLADTAATLHAHGRPHPSVPLVPLRRWFTALLDRPVADAVDPACAPVARELLAATREADVGGPTRDRPPPHPRHTPLHGDLHHGNVLDTAGAWAAIDPKALLGHRAFDLANALCNPDAEIALRHLDARVEVVADRSGIDADVIARWTFAWCGLSGAWSRGRADEHARAVRAIAERLRPRV